MVIRVPDTTALAGWIYDCTATCETIGTGSIVVWDTKRKAQLKEAAMEKILLQVIGKKQADAEEKIQTLRDSIAALKQS
jgi:hypothetical protein